MPFHRPVALVLLAVALPLSPAALADDAYDARHENRSPWLDTATRDGIVHLVDADAARIERYDMNASSWLDPLALPDIATAFVLDEGGIVIATGRSLYAAHPGATSFDFVANTLGDVRSLASDGERLHVSMSARPNHAVRERDTGTLIERRSFHYSMQGTVVAVGHDIVLGRSTGVSPSDIIAVDLGEIDDWRAQRDSDYHGDYPSAERLHLFPDGDRVVDDTGMVYSVPGLAWLGSLAGEVRGVTFEADGLHVLSGSTIRKLSDDYLEHGAHTLDGDVHALFDHGDALFAFGRTTDGETTVDVVSKARVLDETPVTVDPADVTFRADETFGAGDGSVFVLSRAHRALFRRAADADTFDAGYRLRGMPSSVGHAPDAGTLYLGYPSGAITRLDLASGVETSFANLAAGVHAVVPFEGGLFASDAAGAWGSFHTFDESGTALDSVDWRDPTRAPLWIGAMREMLRTDDDRLVAQPIGTDGTLGAERESGHDAGTAYAPLVPSPDRGLVLSGAGTIFDTASFELVESLANDIVDAVWPADDLIVSLARPDEDRWYHHDEDATETTSFRLQWWGARREPLRSLTFEAVDASLVLAGGQARLLVLDAVPGRPRIVGIRMDTDGDGIADTEDAHPLDPDRHEAKPVELDLYPIAGGEDVVTDGDRSVDGDVPVPTTEPVVPEVPRPDSSPADPDVTPVVDGDTADIDVDGPLTPVPTTTTPDADTDDGDGDTVELRVPVEAVDTVNELSRAVEEGNAGGTGAAFLALLAFGAAGRFRRGARVTGDRGSVRQCRARSPCSR